MYIKIPDKKELRAFGLLMGAFLIGIFGLLLPWLFSFSFPVWPWIVAGMLWVPAFLIPNSLKPVYQGWMFIALILGWINTHLLLAIVFYLWITPMGIIMRPFRNPMKSKSSQVESYRDLVLPRSPKHMEHPF